MELAEKVTPIHKADWTKNLIRDKEGKILKIPSNVLIILENDPNLKDRFSYDMTVAATFKTKGLPWSQKDDEYSAADKKIMSDGDFKSLYNYFHNQYGIANTTIIDNTFAEFCMLIQHNPLLDYLNTLQWDGIARVDTLLIDYLSAEDTPYTRAVTRKTLTALVRRAYQPGCKFDECLILKGPQGFGKSTLFKILGGDWYTEDIRISDDTAKTYESHRGKWLCEMGELTSMKKTESERLKSFFSTQIDRYRAPYGKNVMDIPRMCVVVGTTNSDQFLKDITGNRRYWPVEIFDGSTKDVWDDLPNERDQILAEAKTIHESGEPLRLPKEIEKMAELIQQQYVIHDAWTDKVLNYLEIVLHSNWNTMKSYERQKYIDENQDKIHGSNKRDLICIDTIWEECLHGKIENLTPLISGRIRDIMSQSKGWTAFKNPRQMGIGYGKKRGWQKNI